MIKAKDFKKQIEEVLTVKLYKLKGIDGFRKLKDACLKYIGELDDSRNRSVARPLAIARRLEREFIRCEANKYIGTIELIYIESSDIEDIFNESVFFKGEINIKNINHLIRCFNSDKERLDHIFKSEYGVYHFGVIENAIADRYEFELIDFKPLEVESD